jgi:hypothetical protein
LQKINKKGLSQVITSVFIILIVLASIGILFYSINKFIKPALSPEFSCIEAQINPPIKIQLVCYNNQTKDIEINLERSIDEKIPVFSMDFIIDTGDSSETFSCSQSCKNCIILNSGETKKYYFYQDKQPLTITTKISGCLLETKTIGFC